MKYEANAVGYNNIMETLKSRLESGLKDAMRASDDVRRRTIRMVIAAIKLSEVEKGSQLDDVAVMGVLQKEVEIAARIDRRCSKS